MKNLENIKNQLLQGNMIELTNEEDNLTLFKGKFGFVAILNAKTLFGFKTINTFISRLELEIDKRNLELQD
ncbi:MAG TPA: hypothetical protein VNR38_01035 [Ureibacillus sp.]|nr:hypothetical protein [Ureibacillus sp.]